MALWALEKSQRGRLKDQCQFTIQHLHTGHCGEVNIRISLLTEEKAPILQVAQGRSSKPQSQNGGCDGDGGNDAMVTITR